MANTIEIVIKQSGSGSAITDASKALTGLGSSAKGAVGFLGGFGSALGNVATIAGGIVAANVFNRIVEGVTNFVSVGLSAVSSSQQLETSLKALLTSNLMYEQSTQTTTEAITKQIMSTEELGIKNDELTAKLATQKATYQEQEERIRQLTAAYGENGLNVIKAKAQHDQLALSIRDTERDIAGLTATETSYTTVSRQVYSQTLDQASAYKIAARQTQDLLDFTSRLAVISPFETETVEMTTKYAIAAGLGVEQTKEFVPAFLDLAGAVGITSDSLGFAADQLFQVKKIGKLTEVDLRQLRRLGIDLAKVIGVEMGMSVEEFNAQAENSSEIFDELFEAVTRFSQNTFAGTAKEMATSVKGLGSTFSDIFVIGARTFLRPLVDAVTPTVSAIASGLSDFVFGGNVARLGEGLAETFSKGLSKGRAIFAAFGRDWGEGIRMALYQFGFGPDSLAIITSWIDQVKGLLSVFQTEGLFGTGDKGGILRAIGLSDESIGIIQGLVGQIKLAFADLTASIGGVSGADVLGALGIAFTTFALTAIQSINFLAAVWTEHWPTIAATAMTAWTVLQAVFNGIVQGLTATVGPAIDQIGAAFTSLGISWSDVGNALLTATGIVFAGIGAIILVAVSVIVGFVGAVASAVGTMVEYWGLLSQTVSTVVAGIMGVLTSLQAFWTAVFAGDLPGALLATQTGFESMAAIVVGLMATIITAVSGMVETVVSLFSGLITSITGFWQGLFDTLVGGSIIPDLVTSIISWFTSLSDFALPIFETLGSSITTILGSIFGGAEGGGLASILTFDPTLILTGLQAINTFLLETIPASILALSTGFLTFSILLTEQLTALTVGPLTTFIFTLSSIYLLHLPQLVAIWISSTTQIIAQINNTTAAVGMLITTINQAAAAATAMAATIVSGMNQAASAFDQAGDNLEELIEIVKEAAEAFEGMANAAIEAAAAAAAAGGSSGAAGGLGFAAGTGALGFLVPPGFPNDSFPLRVQSGERVLVAPAGRSIEDIVGRQQITNYYFNQTVNTRADSSTVISDFGVMRGLLGV